MVIGGSVVKGGRAKATGLVDALLHAESSVHAEDAQYIVAQVERYATLRRGSVWAPSHLCETYMMLSLRGRQ
jgi:hypothetical protein